MRRFTLGLLVVAAFMLFFLDIGHRHSYVVREIHGFAHLAFFAFLAWLLSRLPVIARHSFHLQCILITAAVLFSGGLIEIIQPYFGRSASWRDMGINLLGGSVGVMFLVPARRSLGRSGLALSQITVIMAVVLASYSPVITLWDIWLASRKFPILSDFETRFEARRWSSGEIRSEVARHGTRSLRVSMGTERYAGTARKRSLGDWRGYSMFTFSLYNPDAAPLLVIVSIRDDDHWHRGGDYYDRFNRVFTVEHGWNEVHIPIADIENAPTDRTMDLSRLSEVVIFTVNPPEPRLMYLDYVRLLR